MIIQIETTFSKVKSANYTSWKRIQIPSGNKGFYLKSISHWDFFWSRVEKYLRTQKKVEHCLTFFCPRVFLSLLFFIREKTLNGKLALTEQIQLASFDN